ncbi:IclR family transcriptional regulator [Streptomyces griseoruber]|uniref:IclR family transcriptional regulator n=1 Tax=Streptomyces TaxID=1883 RepID=UPI00074A778F|nr:MULTISPECIES: IclR family transcriptional regulator [Streptomyces]KUO12959.1 IclR family transcriptional regulator [Streptomyces sp. DSM 15324]MCL6738904.1 IclR family transcriptional regulator [Streptomyces neyagawaensis]MDE1688394.1 IclR family transcriptional regulator [Streptomyces neyagawaensis]
MSGNASPSYRDRNSTADRALDILAMFDDVHLVISGTAVADHLGVARSTAYRYLQSLVNGRFLEEAPGGGFRLGLRVLEIARLARRSYGLSEVAQPSMETLAEDVHETVLLTRRTGDLVVCVDRAESTRAVRISYERGSALPINAGASALVLLAWSPEEEARRLLENAVLRRFTPATLTDVDALMERLGRIRRLGYSVTRGELDPDVVGIAAPIRDENKQVVAAVSVAALASRIYPEAETEIAQKVLTTADEISDRMAVVAG